MELCKHSQDPETCAECNQASETSFIEVDNTASYASRLKAEHPDWFVKDLGWGVIAYDPKDYEEK